MNLLMKKIEESSSKKGIEAIQTPAVVRAVETDPWCKMITRAITAPRPRRR